MCLGYHGHVLHCLDDGFPRHETFEGLALVILAVPRRFRCHCRPPFPRLTLYTGNTNALEAFFLCSLRGYHHHCPWRTENSSTEQASELTHIYCDRGCSNAALFYVLLVNPTLPEGGAGQRARSERAALCWGVRSGSILPDHIQGAVLVFPNTHFARS